MKAEFEPLRSPSAIACFGHADQPTVIPASTQRLRGRGARRASARVGAPAHTPASLRPATPNAALHADARPPSNWLDRRDVDHPTGGAEFWGRCPRKASQQCARLGNLAAMSVSPGDDAKRVAVAWKQIDKLLRDSDPRLLKTLRPKATSRDIRQPVERAWFAGHDGQTPSARPFHDGYRLLSLAESESRRKRHRGVSYRSDWDDSWTVIGARDAQHLLCCYEGVYAVDVSSKSKYKKIRIARSLAEWLAGAATALSGASARTAQKTPAKAAGKRVALPPVSAPLEQSLAAIAAWIAENPEEGYGLAKPAGAATLRRAEKAFGRALPARLRVLALLHDGQPDMGKPIFGQFALLSLASAAKDYALELKVRTQTADAGFWRDEWWPFASDGGGNVMAVDASTGGVIEALNDPYRRKRVDATLDRWLARRARELCKGAFL
jgi:cell wall assembly regulator SMI1